MVIRNDETLAFLCNEDGEVKNWTEVAGGSGMNIKRCYYGNLQVRYYKEVPISDVKRR